MRPQALPHALLIGLSLFVCVPASAQSAFDSFYGPASATSYPLSGNDPTFPQRLAWRFTAAAGGDVTALSISAYRPSASTTPYTLALYASSGTQVGTLLGSFPVLLPQGSASAPVTIDTPASGVLLSQGQDYFFSLELPGGPISRSAQWHIHTPSTAGPQASWSGAGPWQYFSDPNTHYPAFRVTVPAPSAAALLGLALGTTFLAPRRRLRSED